MPASATITTYYSFSASTKARASQVNANFSNHRGHSLPIDPTAASASDNAYDLGSSEHRWRYAYIGTALDLKSSTSTGAAVQLLADSSATTGSFLCQIAGSNKMRVNALGMDMQYGNWAGATNTVETFACKNAVSAVIGPTTGGSNSASFATVLSTSLTVVAGRPVYALLFSGEANGRAFYAVSAAAGTSAGGVKFLISGVATTTPSPIFPIPGGTGDALPALHTVVMPNANGSLGIAVQIKSDGVVTVNADTITLYLYQ